MRQLKGNSLFEAEDWSEGAGLHPAIFAYTTDESSLMAFLTPYLALVWNMVVAEYEEDDIHGHMSLIILFTHILYTRLFLEAQNTASGKNHCASYSVEQKDGNKYRSSCPPTNSHPSDVQGLRVSSRWSDSRHLPLVMKWDVSTPIFSHTLLTWLWVNVARQGNKVTGECAMSVVWSLHKLVFSLSLSFVTMFFHHLVTVLHFCFWFISYSYLVVKLQWFLKG